MRAKQQFLEGWWEVCVHGLDLITFCFLIYAGGNLTAHTALRKHIVKVTHSSVSQQTYSSDWQIPAPTHCSVCLSDGFSAFMSNDVSHLSNDTIVCNTLLCVCHTSIITQLQWAQFSKMNDVKLCYTDELIISV